MSVVVPVFNQATSITHNLEVIRERVGAELDAPFEVVVVSDGSIDATEEELVAGAPTGAFRVFHYDRNLGKGYAVKIGALEAEGEWIGFIDADLDLDPASLATFVRRAQSESLDFAIGSKRHPESQVHYPPVRVAASWLFQQLVRALFRLNVRDTQVGLKVFHRRIAEQVLPLLLVKRYAFDIELLAVARAFGFSRIEELPIQLEYRFTGSGVRSRAVLRALVDTAAIFYRLRILRYYQRRRAIAGAFGWSRPRAPQLLVSILAPGGATYRDITYSEVEVLDAGAGTLGEIRRAARSARGDVLAILEPGARPAANWLSATAPFFARREITAVVFPKVAPLTGSARARAAAAIDESRIGAGLGYFRYTPGNLRFVHDFPATSLLVRRDEFNALPDDVPIADVVAALWATGGFVLYTPESVIVAEAQPLFRPHLRVVFARGRSRGAAARRGRFSLSAAVRVALPFALAAAIVAAAAAEGLAVDVLGTPLAAYALAVLVASAAAGLRHQSVTVAALAAVGIVCTHVVYLAGLIRGLII